VSKLPVLLLLAAFGSTAFAATPVPVEKHVKVAQVEQLLTVAHHQRDMKVAKQLAGLEMTERVTSLRLSRWQADFAGAQTREALLALADASAFLDLPAADIPSIAMPDEATRKQILSRVIEYVRTTIHQLPNFFATRSTTHFDDTPVMVKMTSVIMSGSGKFAGNSVTTSASPGLRLLHGVSMAAILVTYLNGLEVEDAAAGKHRGPRYQEMGLTTSGEFGPVLSIAIGDAIRGRVFWGHWEQGASGALAVLRYSVPQEISHYSVAFGVVGNDSKPQFPAYHGEIAVDPTNGTILRLTMESELNPPHQTFKSSIVVEYGPVTIGNRDYICPIKSEALSKVTNSSTDEKGAVTETGYLTFLNDVSFTQYHVFRADARILP
jgi:hypothetical protein